MIVGIVSSALPRKEPPGKRSWLKRSSGILLGQTVCFCPFYLRSRVVLSRDFMTLSVEEDGVLGRGAFGDAVLCKYKKTGMQYVVKRIPKLLDDSGTPETIPSQLWQQEVKTIADVSSSHIVSIFDAFEDQFYMYIVMEYCAKGNLRGLLLSLEMGGKTVSEAVCLF
jgi:hypothetical protein